MIFFQALREYSLAPQYRPGCLRYLLADSVMSVGSIPELIGASNRPTHQACLQFISLRLRPIKTISEFMAIYSDFVVGELD